MIALFEKNPRATVSLDQFVAACVQHGYPTTYVRNKLQATLGRSSGGHIGASWGKWVIGKLSG